MHTQLVCQLLGPAMVMTNMKTIKKTKGFPVAAGFPGRAWFPMMVLGLQMMRQRPVPLRKKKRHSRRNPEADPPQPDLALCPVVEGNGFRSSSGLLVSHGATTVTRDAADGNAAVHGPSSTSADEALLDRFAKACNCELGDFLQWSGLPRRAVQWLFSPNTDLYFLYKY